MRTKRFTPKAFQRFNKFKAIKTQIDGIQFASKGESKRYLELKILLKAGRIKDLELQECFPLIVNKTLVCNYFTDFSYFDLALGCKVVEDFKGRILPEAKLKLKLFMALYPKQLLRITTSEGSKDYLTRFTNKRSKRS